MKYLRLLRPEQWVKNLFVFAGVIFGQKLTDSHALLLSALGFAAFCLASSAVYVLNDIRDQAEDRLHPRKRHRPVASGAVSAGRAGVLAGLLMLVGLGGAWWLDAGFGAVVAAYLALQALYILGLKHAAIIDVISIGLGFVLRAISGPILIHVEVSPWLVLCTFTLCLFMGYSKRRCELNAMRADGGDVAHAGRHRRTLLLYTPDLLNHMTTLTAGIAIVSFMLYAMDAATVRKFGSNYLLYTLPFVVYAIFRFALRVEHGDVDGPTDIVLKDRPFQVAIVLWVAAALLVVYRGPQLEALVKWLRQ